MPAKRVKIAAAFTIVAGLLVWLTISGFDENMQYYRDVKDLKSLPASELSKGLRVKGYLVAGSVERADNTSLERFFLIEESGHQLRVRYDKELPDTFKDGAEVLVEGKMTEAGYFDAKMLMAKCPSKYESTEEFNARDYDPAKYQNRDGTN
ncbi:MAG: cytochrome c maturation protein CcmE [bacterium]